MKKKIFSYTFIMLICTFAFCNTVSAFTCSAFDNAEIDDQLAFITKNVILILEVAVPIILVILGLVDFIKAMTSQKEDEIKKGQQTFIKRVIAAILVFFVIAIVKFAISMVAGGADGSVMSCANCFIKGPGDPNCN